MKLLIILPNWLGDAIMATPAIEALTKRYPQAQLTFVGSHVAIEALKHHPQCERAVVDTTKKSRFRLGAVVALAKTLGSFDVAVTFRKNIYASLLLYYSKATVRIGRHTWYNRLLLTQTYVFSNGVHLVKNYAQFAQATQPKDLVLYIAKKVYEKPTLGINPGATYGSAKRWYPEYFAQVAHHFSTRFDIVIFGGPSEVDMGDAIALKLQELGVTNYVNMAGKTSVQELISRVAGCELFITNDSGPMHIAAAYKVPLVAVFGPTRDTETAPWAHKKAAIAKLGLACAPCMKRVCPLKHHECMKNLTPQMVIEKAQTLLTKESS